jgi:hypothetical protein
MDAMKYNAESSGLSERYHDNYLEAVTPRMYLPWFGLAHHDPDQALKGRGLPVPVLPGFPLNLCGNDGLLKEKMI